MKIEDRLLRNDDEDILEIGRIAGELLDGDRGALLQALTTGAIWTVLRELDIVGITGESACAVLGELKGYTTVLENIEQCIVNKADKVNSLNVQAQIEADELLETESKIPSTPDNYRGQGIV